MRTLFVSDLDGTLLNPAAELTAATAEKLNELIGQGAAFSIATARTWETVRYLMQDVHLQLPVILMNGVCLYDPVEARYLQAATIAERAARRVFKAMAGADVHPFLYKIENDALDVYYETLANAAMEEFVAERRRKYNKKFIHIPVLADAIDSRVIYICMLSDKAHLDPVFEAIHEDPDLHVEYYQDIYSSGFYYLEVCSGGASKAEAVRQLKENFGFDRLVVFGDNANDLPMFAEADECYAVANAVPAVKEAADGVIGANTEDGVPEYMKGRQNGLL